MRKKARIDIYDKHRIDRDSMNETNDCTVTSLAHVLDIGYRDAHALMAKAGRLHRKGASMHMAAQLVGPRMTKIKLPDDQSVTLNEFCQVHTTGRYWVKVAGHALAVVSGRICDHSDKRRRRVINAYKVHSEPQQRIEHHG